MSTSSDSEADVEPRSKQRRLVASNENEQNVNSPRNMQTNVEEGHQEGASSNVDQALQIENEIDGGCRCFDDVEQAFVFYCEYARHKGFIVRRGDQRYVGNTQIIRWKEFVCSCAGKPCGKFSNGRTGRCRKPILRSDCKAKIRVHPLKSGAWKISTFQKEHNHPLINKNQANLLRSSRKLSDPRKGLLEAMISDGITVGNVYGNMEVHSNGPQNASDHIRPKELDNGDSASLLDFFNKKANSEPCFFWKTHYNVDDGRLLHFFFRDFRCFDDYEALGDILSIDTSYRTNRYNLSCVPFIGVNHHRANVMFGIAFLSDETTQTFEWLFDAFLESMKGKQPKVVFSDQCRALMNAIGKKFPDATHRLCQWHINNNAIKHFESLNGNDEFKRMWYKCMNGVETEEEFESLWSEMMQSHVPPDHTWLRNIYHLRHRWASVFSQEVFTAGLHATSQSEGTNRVFESIESSNSLHDCLTCYERIQSRWRAMESAEDAACLCLPEQFVKNNMLLMQAATVYTHANFRKFEYQCIESFNVEVDSAHARDLGDGDIEFKAYQNPDARPRTVVFNAFTNSARCSCHMWEVDGIVCRHIIKVYQIRNVRQVPESFILRRWTKIAKTKPIPPGQERSMMQPSDFVNLVMRSYYDMACSAKDSAAEQKFIIKQMDATKGGLAAMKCGAPHSETALNGTVPPTRRSADGKFLGQYIVQIFGTIKFFF